MIYYQCRESNHPVWNVSYWKLHLIHHMQLMRTHKSKSDQERNETCTLHSGRPPFLKQEASQPVHVERKTLTFLLATGRAPSPDQQNDSIQAQVVTPKSYWSQETRPGLISIAAASWNSPAPKENYITRAWTTICRQLHHRVPSNSYHLCDSGGRPCEFCDRPNFLSL